MDYNMIYHDLTTGYVPLFFGCTNCGCRQVTLFKDGLKANCRRLPWRASWTCSVKVSSVIHELATKQGRGPIRGISKARKPCLIYAKSAVNGDACIQDTCLLDSWGRQSLNLRNDRNVGVKICSASKLRVSATTLILILPRHHCF